MVHAVCTTTERLAGELTLSAFCHLCTAKSWTKGCCCHYCKCCLSVQCKLWRLREPFSPTAVEQKLLFCLILRSECVEAQRSCGNGNQCHSDTSSDLTAGRVLAKTSQTKQSCPSGRVRQGGSDCLVQLVSFFTTSQYMCTHVAPGVHMGHH